MKEKNILLKILFLFVLTQTAFAEVSVNVLGQKYSRELDAIVKDVSSRTSMDMGETILYQDVNTKTLTEGWYWVRDPKLLVDAKGLLKTEFRQWIKRGGFLIVQGMELGFLTKLMKGAFASESPEAQWQVIPPDHELMRSFYLIDALPSCRGQIWNGYIFDGRLAVLAIPFDFLQALSDRSDTLGSCEQKLGWEYKFRLFINIAMAALATDYKRDQIHMREILKRLH